MHVLPVSGGGVEWQDTCQRLATFTEVALFGKITSLM